MHWSRRWASKWKYFVYVFPADLGQGIIYPAILFTSLASFDHAGKPITSAVAHSLTSLTKTLLDHAVSASTVYLIRSLGTVWGVSVTSAIVQTTLTTRLPSALAGIPHENDVSCALSVKETPDHGINHARSSIKFDTPWTLSTTSHQKRS